MPSENETMQQTVDPVMDVRRVLEGVCDLIERNRAEIEERRYQITWKADGSPVTEADTYVEPLVEAYLRQELGSITFVGEETYAPGSRTLDGWTAVLDPIDGTENFCSGLQEWGISLTLWRDGSHAGSLLLLPELGQRLLTGDRITPVVSRITGFSSSISDELVSELAVTGEARISGCAVFNLMNVIHGSFRRFVNPVGAFSWDLLGGVMLALEHGCLVEIDGEVYAGEYLEPGRRYRVDIRHGSNSDSGQGSIR